MADAFKSDYFNMPVHVRKREFWESWGVTTFTPCQFLSHFLGCVLAADGAHRAGGERVLAFGRRHRRGRDGGVRSGYCLEGVWKWIPHSQWKIQGFPC